MHEPHSITLRKAHEDDQPVIRRMVMSECLNPRAVHWQNFLVAEAGDRIVGIGQIRLHGRIKELGSLVVLPEYRGQGVGAALMEALETRGGLPMYLMCASHNIPYYQRYGYSLVHGAEIPAEMLPPGWIVWAAEHLLRARINIMRKDAA